MNITDLEEAADLKPQDVLPATAKGDEFRPGLPPLALRMAWKEWERRWNPDGVKRKTWRCRFEGDTYQAEGGESFSIPAIKIWHEIEFRPHGKTRAEVEILAAKMLGAGDAREGRQKMHTPALYEALGKSMYETAECVAAYDSAYDAAKGG